MITVQLVYNHRLDCSIRPQLNQHLLNDLDINGYVYIVFIYLTIFLYFKQREFYFLFCFNMGSRALPSHRQLTVRTHVDVFFFASAAVLATKNSFSIKKKNI